MKPKRTLARKLTMSYMLMICVPLLLVCLLIIQMLNDQFQTRVLDSMLSNAKQLTLMLENQIESTFQQADAFAADRRVDTILAQPVRRDAELVHDLVDELIPRLRSFSSQGNAVRAARVLHANPRLYEIYDILYYDAQLTANWEAHFQALSGVEAYTKDTTFIECVQSRPVYVPYARQESGYAWTVYRTQYDRTWNRLNWVLELTLDSQLFYAPLEHHSLNGRENLYLLHDSLGPLYEKGAQMPDIQPQDIEGRRDGREAVFAQEGVHVVACRSDLLRSWLVYRVPMQDMRLDRRTTGTVLGLLSIALFALGAIAGLVMRRALKNLTSLTRAIGDIHNLAILERSPHVLIPSNDEIQVLADAYNGMIDRLAEATRTEQRMMYHQLTHQIRPHFLCNALDVVRMTAEQRHEFQLAESVVLISRYFQNMTDTRLSAAPLREECALVTDYIHLINLLRECPILCTIRHLCDEALLDQLVLPRFVLQPFVENAVNHGFRQREAHCAIHITTEIRDNGLCIVIEDNGCGIEAEKLAHIHDRLRRLEEMDDQSIGLVNPISRLMLFTDGRMTYQIESFVDAGTLVRLSLPLAYCQMKAERDLA